MCIRDRAIVNHYYCADRKLNMPLYQEDNPELWLEKLEEIREFQRTKARGQISEAQAERLITVYNNYRHIFWNALGKVKNYQCTIKFKTPVEFNKKSYPIAYSLKNEVREELNRMVEDDITEYSHSPYTSPVSYTHLDVYKRQI